MHAPTLGRSPAGALVALATVVLAAVVGVVVIAAGWSGVLASAAVLPGRALGAALGLLARVALSFRSALGSIEPGGRDHGWHRTVRHGSH